MATPDQIRRRGRWSLILGTLIATAALAVVAYADTITPDGDTITPGDQSSVNLGTVAPGAVLTPSTSFRLTCTGKQHPDQGQTISLTFNLGSSTVPAGSLSATNPTVGAIPASWPDDTTGGGSTNCSSPAQTLGDNGDSTVTITAPSGAGTYVYVVVWGFGLSPSDPDPGGDSSALVGNSTNVTYTLTVATPDTTPPTINCTVPNQAVWYGTDVTVNCTASDSGSGLANAADSSFSLSTSVPSGTETANAQTDSRQVCDKASPQNCATAGPYTFMVDKRAPQLSSCDAPDGAWHADNVTLMCDYTDGGSGPATQDVNLMTNVAAGSEDANASASAGGAQACDAVGNCAASPADIGGNMVDRKAPTITCNSPAPTFLLNQSPANVTGVAADGGSGPASQNLSAPADTSSVLGNPKSVVLNAADNVGNGSSKPCYYSVIFDFHGFFQPVDNLPTMNAVKAGSAVPLKFDLSGNQGLNVFAAGYPKTKMISCNDSSPLDDIETTVTAGGSSLNYDGGVNPPIGQYIYVWKTEKSWVGTCRELDVMLVDGTIHSAKFKFK